MVAGEAGDHAVPNVVLFGGSRAREEGGEGVGAMSRRDDFEDL